MSAKCHEELFVGIVRRTQYTYVPHISIHKHNHVYSESNKVPSASSQAPSKANESCSIASYEFLAHMNACLEHQGVAIIMFVSVKAVSSTCLRAWLEHMSHELFGEIREGH